MRFLRPIVPILSQNDSSLSSFLGKTGVRGDLGRGEDMIRALRGKQTKFYTVPNLGNSQQILLLP